LNKFLILPIGEILFQYQDAHDKIKKATLRSPC